MTLAQFKKSLTFAQESGLLAPVWGIITPAVLNTDIMAHIKEQLDLAQADVIMLEPEEDARSLKIEAVREWMSKIQLSARREFKLGIIVSADLLTKEAANSLLKTLEEPPNNTYLVLLATRDNFLPTIRSRLQLFFIDQTISTDYDDISIPETVSDIISTAAVWQKEGELFHQLRRLVEQAHLGLRNSTISAVQAERIHNAYTQISLGQNQRLLVENILLRSYGKNDIKTIY